MPYALPPAESKLPLRAIAAGFLPSRVDFAQKLQEYLHTDACVLANSGRTLLYILFRTLQSRASFDGGQVMVPGYTCYSVAAAAVKAGLNVAPYDLDPRTFQPDMEDVRRKINARTLAVVGQHLLGVPADIGRLAEIAHHRDVCCIEDSAQLLGANQKALEQRCSADYTFFSFGRGKPLPLGGGGALISAKPEALPRIADDLEASRHTAVHSMAPIAVRILARPRLYWILEKLPFGLGQTVCDPSFPVSKMPISYQRVGAAALACLESLNQHRTAIGGRYHGYFTGQEDSGRAPKRPAYTRYPLLVQNQVEARRLAKQGVRQLYPLALCDVPALRNSIAMSEGPTPGACEIADRLITLPTHLSVDYGMADQLAIAVRSVFRKIAPISLA